MLLGGHGVISVTANVAPKLMHEMCGRRWPGTLSSAREINARLFLLHSKLFVEANPIPVKWALAQMGKISRGMRLPLTPLSEAQHETLRGAMRHAGIDVRRDGRARITLVVAGLMLLSGCESLGILERKASTTSPPRARNEPWKCRPI